MSVQVYCFRCKQISERPTVNWMAVGTKRMPDGTILPALYCCGHGVPAHNFKIIEWVRPPKGTK